MQKPLNKPQRSNPMSLLGVLLILFSMLGFGGAATAQEGIRIAAVVNDEAISLLDLESRIIMAIASSNTKDGAETRRRMAPSILRSLIEERLMLQEARRLGIKVSTTEVENGIALIEKQNGMPSGSLLQFLKSAGVPISTLATRTEAEIGWNKVIGREVLPDIRVSDEEINDAIKSIQANAGKPQYLIAEIYLPINDPSEEGGAKQVANQLFEQLKNGASFPRIARNFSNSPSSATGGDLGWLSYGQVNPEISAIIKAMKPGQVSLPIRTVGGYYIVMLRNLRVNPGLGSNETTLGLSQFHMSFSNGASEAEKNEKRARLVSMSSAASSCEELKIASAKAGSPLSGSLGKVKLSSLPQKMKMELASLPVGKISNPLETGGGLAVIMVCSRQEGKTNMDEVKKNIEEKIKIGRLGVAAAGYLRGLKREAFVDVRL
ncbi:MAG: peptidylprolyl isomerase [Rhodospirillaceae bacterium]|nr:peptidylprolyl isomerase [Rhodospirillaceae bacterium]